MPIKLHLNISLETNNDNAFPIPLKIPQINGYTKYFDKNNKYIIF